MGKILIVAALLWAGCAGDPPSCQTAVEHYYAVGCVLRNPANNVPYSVNEVITSCKQTLAAAPDSCVDDVGNLNECFNSVEGHTDSGCDCSSEQDALYTCD